MEDEAILQVELGHYVSLAGRLIRLLKRTEPRDVMYGNFITADRSLWELVRE